MHTFFAKTFKTTTLIFPLLMLGSLLIRLYGVDYGLPRIYDPDEPIYVAIASTMLANHDLNPHWFGNPGSPTVYLMAFVYIVTFGIGYLTGVFRSPEDFRTLYHQDPTLVYLSGRLIVVVFSLASVWLTIKIARRLFNSSTAIMAGALITLSPLYVYFSKIIRTDIQATFWILLSFWFCLNILERPSLHNYLLAGLFAGIGVATKYPAVMVALCIILAFILKKQWKHFYFLVASGFASIMGTFLCSPFLFIDFSKALQDLLYESRNYHLSHTGNGIISNAFWYITNPLKDTFTFLGIILIALGIWFCLRTKTSSRLLLISFPLIFWLFISSLHLVWGRWIIPTIPYGAILLAHAIDELRVKLERFFPIPFAKWAIIGLFAAIIIPLFFTTLEESARLAGTDTRTIAEDWILANIPANSRILSERYTSSLPENYFQYYYIDEQGDLAKFEPTNYYKLYGPRGHIGQIKDPILLQTSLVEYVIMSNMYERYLSEKELYPTIVQNYEMIMQQGKLIFSVSPLPWKINGPEIRIYQISR